MNKKYFTTRSKNKAITISYLLNEDFMAFTDMRDKTKDVYSFRNSEKLQEVLKIVEKYHK